MQNFDALKDLMDNSKITYEKEKSMKILTSFKIGGRCKIVAYPENLEQLKILIRFCKEKNIKHYYLGNASNVLACDEDYFGVLICSRKLNKIEILSNNRIYCESGVNLLFLCRFLYLNSLSGLEQLYGIPGSVGGAIYMNAGAYGKEIKDVVESVSHLDEDGNLKTLKTKDLDFSYRHSVYENYKNFIVSAILKVVVSNKEKIKSVMDEIFQKRLQKQPLNFPNAGSIFKRPKNDFAARLIEECGLKGLTVGGAKVSTKHCGFIINFNKATALDVKKLIEKVKKTVKIKKNVDLKTEIKFIE